MNDLNAVLEQAYSLYNNKEFEAALEKITTAENFIENGNLNLPDDQLAETTASLQNFKGFNYLSLNNISDAKTCFEKSLHVNPNSSQACAGLGEILYLNSKDEEAKIMFEWSIDNNPYNQFALQGLAKVNKAMGLPEEHNTLNIDTTLPEKGNEFFESLTEAYRLFREKRYEDSLERLGIAEKYLSGSVMSNANSMKIASLENFKGFNLLALYRMDEARDSFEKALNINPVSSQACAGLAEIFYLLEEDQNAKTMFEWAVKNNPENKFAVSGLEKSNANLGLDADHNTLN